MLFDGSNVGKLIVRSLTLSEQIVYGQAIRSPS
jgi:hypothetical protein